MNFAWLEAKTEKAFVFLHLASQIEKQAGGIEPAGRGLPSLKSEATVDEPTGSYPCHYYILRSVNCDV